MKCRQCGQEKTAFYKGRRKCKECEAINHRYKYIKKNPEKHQTEIAQIEALYKLQAERGLHPPKTRPHVAVAQQLENETTMRPEGPEDLVKWLVKELHEEPEYLLDTVYEELKARYAPQVGVDPKTFLPVYDEKYASVLALILSRFNKYEDDYYNL